MNFRHFGTNQLYVSWLSNRPHTVAHRAPELRGLWVAKRCATAMCAKAPRRAYDNRCFPKGPTRMRAPRFPLTLPIRCRRAGNERWIEGVTINISRSGVLFRTSMPLDIDTPVEMTIVLGGSSMTPGELRCDGHIVRIASADSTTASMAAAFSTYDLRRRMEIEAESRIH